MLPRRSDRVRSYLRCFAIQGSWNYRTLVAGGLVYAMLPLLRRIYAGDPIRLRDAVERHLKAFNGHPYLCPMAVGALARLEQEDRPVEEIERFRTALRAPLGAVGDELVWATWRPFCLLLAMLLFGLDGRPWMSVFVFLLLYNSGHVALRAWAFRHGWSASLRVGRELADPPWGSAVRWLTNLNLVLVGTAIVLVAWYVAGDLLRQWEVLVVLVVAALAGYARPALGERAAAALVLAAPLALLILGG